MTNNVTKSEAALRTIGEVADEINVATHVLRFWESKFPQIKPKKRRGRRYYRLEDIIIIKKVQDLLYQQGYTIRGVQKFFSTNNNLSLSDSRDINKFNIEESSDLVDNLTLSLFDQPDTSNKQPVTETSIKNKDLDKSPTFEKPIIKEPSSFDNDFDSIKYEQSDCRVELSASDKQDLQKILYDLIKSRNILEELSFSN